MCRGMREATVVILYLIYLLFFFNDTATTEIYTLSLHDALPIFGSAGQPRDRNTAACYALADLARSRITFFRVPYDHGTAAQKIRAAGLPERLARRLERGS